MYLKRAHPAFLTTLVVLVMVGGEGLIEKGTKSLSLLFIFFENTNNFFFVNSEHVRDG